MSRNDTLEQHAGWRETYRGTVRAWESDIYEHFTIAYYHDRFADGTLNLLAEAGLGPRFIDEEHRALATVRTYVRYLEELRGGDLLHLRSAVIAVSERGARIGHELYNSATGALAATAELRLRYMDLDRRRGARLSSEQRSRLEALCVPWPAPRTAALPPPPGPYLDTFRDTVKPWEIDLLGHLSLSCYIHRFSDAVNQALGEIGMSPLYLRENRRGFSTFELQGRFVRELSTGDRIGCRTAFAHVGRTSLRVHSTMYNLDSGDRVAELEQSGVHLDLDRRRPTPLPEPLRKRANALLAGAPRLGSGRKGDALIFPRSHGKISASPFPSSL